MNEQGFKQGSPVSSEAAESKGPEFEHGALAVIALYAVHLAVWGLSALAAYGLSSAGIEARILANSEIHRIVAWTIVVYGAVRISRSPWREVAPRSQFARRSLIPLVVFCWSSTILVAQTAYLAFSAPQEDVAIQWRQVFEPASLFGMLIVAPITEELLFRGWMLRGFRAHYSTRTAVLLSSVMFAAVHWGLPQMTLAFLVGIFNAWLVIRTQSIVPAIVAHLAINATARLLLLGLLPFYNIDEQATMDRMPATVLVAATIGTIVTAVILHRQLSHRRPNLRH